MAVIEPVTDCSGLVMRETIHMVTARISSAAKQAAIAIIEIACASMPSSCAIGMPTNSKPMVLPAPSIDRVIGRVVALAEQHRRPLVGLALADHRLRWMIGRKLRADGAIAVFLLQVRGAADELFRRVVIDEQRGDAADESRGAVDDLVILEFGHGANFGARDLAVLQRDLHVRHRFGEGEPECAQVDLDIGAGAVGELVGQRPVARANHERGVGRDQDRRADERLGAELQLQGRKFQRESHW